MNEETNDFLRNNLEDAHEIFKTVIAEMKQNNIEADYRELEVGEINCYETVATIMNRMSYCVYQANSLKDNHLEILDVEYKLYLKYLSLYLVTLVFLRVFGEIFDTSELNDMVKYIVGLFLGSVYVGLLSKDINDNRNDTKDKRDVLNELKTLKEEYKKDHDQAVCEIDGIFKLNDILWSKLEREKGKTM